jgi:hypothetical protein
VADISEPDAICAINPERLQMLRHIEDKIVCKACKCLRSNIVLVKTLMSINTAFATKIPSLGESSYSVHQELQIMEHRLESHINAAETLAQRVQATLGLVRKTNSQTQAITDLFIAHQSSRYRKSGKL